jgi:hypothetical protein
MEKGSFDYVGSITTEHDRLRKSLIMRAGSESAAILKHSD